ncbi:MULTISPECIES: branched-chain amino acid aminotransferase [unclassified Mucilaginibacter]|uniref:branched-chain amino acid aminotransferase n=1 Tax=unclassified Mucilaginibacter TaxID=2617802 RepID=UPI002AC94025|nr:MULTISPECIES: branched-chain amino acid aminotransferase [unclassified Mucilaginibacter]MEB0264009.1 branched-chain amino acid aminotransferase [Mucilaginibacter sp. 10I4]MEB0278539.1 branched-chain amino acid aminotransferase [Mucilaginibacter sp. 10B2]MEB0299250.1 branched-chain amino acid aminotransferase [Mucilaginibacter sp. 5C4]WPX23505.1 branched-chain amino acid aminotransferase [Mucilaginibacter sp. 5C4]
MTDTLDIKITKAAHSRLAETDFNTLPFGKVFSDHMFSADYIDGEWKNFEILPYGPILMSPAISSLHYGQSFFEGIKAYKHADGKASIFRPDKNAARFNKSAERLCMPTLPEELFVQTIATLVDLDRDWIPAKANHALYIRPFMFATDPYLGVTPSATYKYMVIVGPVGPYFSKPLRVKIETHYTRAAEGGMGYAKAAGNYGSSMLPARKATEEGFDQLIWTDAKEHKYIEEMGAANAMFLLDGKLITAEAKDTILDGVTRDTVIALAKSWGIPVEERKVSVAELIEGAKNSKLTDAFGAGTAATIASVASISFEGEEYFLSDPATREFSKRVLSTLDDIKYGRTEDTNGWNYMV